MSIHNEGDYVAPVTKTKISRARKMVIGMLAVGTAVALGGAGTFASFSASTTNDATFQTENLLLTNQVGAGTVCESNGNASTIDNTGGANSNDNACDSIWTTAEDSVGVEYTKTITITNGGNSAHNIFLWNTGVCVSTASVQSQTEGDTSLCGAAKISVHNDTENICEYPAGAGACSNVTSGGGGLISGFPTTFATKTAVTGSALAASASNVYTLKLFVPHHSTCGFAAGFDYDRTSAGVDDESVANGGLFSSGGVSCDNHYINKKAELKLKWWMESAN